MTDYDSNGLDENSARFFKQMEFDKKNQFHESNRPDPSGWAEMVEEQLKAKYWRGGTAVNLLCAFRPDRSSYSLNPLDIEAESESFNQSRRENPWEIDDVERKYFKILRLVSLAIDSGDIPSTDDPAVLQPTRENLVLFGPPLPQTRISRMVKPRDLLVWAYKNLDEVPGQLIDRYKVPKIDSLPPEQLIRVLRAKLTKSKTKEANLVAVLALILENHERFVHGKSIRLQQVLYEVERICNTQLAPEVLGFQHSKDGFEMRAFQKLINPVKRKLSEHRKK